MRTISIVVAVVAAACSPRSDGTAFHDAKPPHPPPDIAIPDSNPDAPVDATASFCDGLDILFVLDNSSGMAAYQANIGANAQKMIDALDATGLSYRIGFTTASRQYVYYFSTPFGPSAVRINGDSGQIFEMVGCGMHRQWVNYKDPDRADQLACGVKQGATGPAQQMPLGAMRDAFDGRITDNTNTRFHRKDALLGVILVTDNEDCSYVNSVTLSNTQTFCVDQIEPVDNYSMFMDTYTGGRSHWAAHVIANTGSAMCTDGLGTANPSIRLPVWVSDLGMQASSSNICTNDLSPGIVQAVTTFTNACMAMH